MNFAKFRALTAAAALVAAFAASTASAAFVATNNFESALDSAEFTTDDGLELTDVSTITDYDGDAPSGAVAVPGPFADYGSKYLAVDTGDAMLWRTFASRSATTYFDSVVKFSPTTGDIEYPDNSKFVVFLDAATSNLCVISGTSADVRTPVTNRLTNVTVVPDTWGRLTIEADIADSVFAFQVRVNGTLLQTADATPVTTFYSLTSDTSLTEVGIRGTGAVDDLVVRTTPPAYNGAAAKIGDEDFATLEDALAAANGATVTLAAGHAAVGISAPGTYLVNTNGYAFGGLVGLGGAAVAASTSGSVTTYTVVAPAVVWDGAASQYDFSTLTRVNGDNTYTMNINEMNTVDDNHSFVRIGDENAKKAVTITAVNSDPSITNAFGTAGQISVIMKSRGLALEDNSARGLIGVMDGNLYRSNDNGVKVGSATRNKTALAVFWNGYYYNQQTSPSPALSTGEQRHAFAYDSTSAGAIAYLDGTRVYSNNGAVDANFKVPTGIILGGVDTDGSGMMYAQCGLEIEAVAVFAAKLTDAQIASYVFPSEIDPDIDPGATISVAVDTPVSTINSLLPGKPEIWVLAADGVTITGDTTFTATKVHFASTGSITIKPPAGNVATFDFSGVAGRPVIEYTAMPTVSGSVFTSTTVPEFVTDSTKWSGVIYISGGSFTDFTSNAFGNETSVVRLGNVSGWLRAPGNYAFTNTVPVELVGTLLINNGSSANDDNPNRCTVFKKLSGSGYINADNTADKVVVVIQDASEFTGYIGLNGKLIVFGDAMPSYADNSKFQNMTASIWVMEGASITANPTSGNTWWAVRGIKVYGELRAANLDKFGGETKIATYDTGTFTLTSTGNGQEGETETSYARISGTGTLKYEGAGWRALSTNNFPTNMTLMNEQAGDLLLSRAQTYTVGSFAGSKNLQGNYGTGDRYLRVLQAKDTEWSGKIKDDTTYGAARFKGLIVAPGTGSSPTGTLTLAGTQTQSATLTVEAGAKVNITGKWKGSVTVAGSLSGTGTVDGAVTLSDGAALRVGDMSDGLAVTSLAIAEGGKISVYLPAGATAGEKFLTGLVTIPANATFRVYVNGVLNPALTVTDDNGGGLKTKRRGAVFQLF